MRYMVFEWLHDFFPTPCTLCAPIVTVINRVRQRYGVTPLTAATATAPVPAHRSGAPADKHITRSQRAGGVADFCAVVRPVPPDGSLPLPRPCSWGRRPFAQIEH